MDLKIIALYCPHILHYYSVLIDDPNLILVTTATTDFFKPAPLFTGLNSVVVPQNWQIWGLMYGMIKECHGNGNQECLWSRSVGPVFISPRSDCSVPLSSTCWQTTLYKLQWGDFGWRRCLFNTLLMLILLMMLVFWWFRYWVWYISNSKRGCIT